MNLPPNRIRGLAEWPEGCDNHFGPVSRRKNAVDDPCPSFCDGRRVRHDALTNRMEPFAEMTEADLGVNGFFPFNRAELKEAEPEVHALMSAVWGSPPRKPK